MEILFAKIAKNLENFVFSWQDLEKRAKFVKFAKPNMSSFKIIFPNNKKSFSWKDKLHKF